MEDIQKDINDFLDCIDGKISEKEYLENHKPTYKMTVKDIKEMQDDADRELFGSGCSYE